MRLEIRITSGPIHLCGWLNDGPTATAIAEALPLRARAQRWGDEIYFSIPVEAELEDNSRQVVEAGELGYWPSGTAFCIFFGPTPASQGDEIRAASNVNIIGRLEDDLSGLRTVQSGAEIRVEVV